jgi:phosphoserine aminotransferase
LAAKGLRHLRPIVSRIDWNEQPPGLRIWGGATVDTSDIQALLPWLDWRTGK